MTIPWIAVSERLPTDQAWGGPGIIVLYYIDGEWSLNEELLHPSLWRPPYMRTPDYWVSLDKIPMPAPPVSNTPQHRTEQS